MKCKNLDEIRDNIDEIDRKIIKLVAKRGDFVKQAAKFKTTGDEVKAPQRVESIILKVRKLSTDYGANPDILENLYRNMISDFINLEMNEYKNS